ncbi:MAG: fibrobacter succinogenes major paralogous domain-containing protein [Bacteroidales bacterium]|nr:fibrobacter succinogenes major paralogous domain-containing protein [Bacteroidales bacterium]
MNSFRIALFIAISMNFVITTSAQDSISVTHANDSVTDIDGNTYATIRLGDQVWMSENLRVTHYPDSKPIIRVLKRRDWKKLSVAGRAYCYHNNDEVAFSETYGALYSWAAAVNYDPLNKYDGRRVQGICPDGWHIPGDAEWKQLEIYLGMSKAAADNVKERGTIEGSKLAGDRSLWVQDKLTEKSEFGASGFNALPGSFRYDYSHFYMIGNSTYWWTSTEFNPNFAWYRGISYVGSTIYRYTIDKRHGFSVRCIKDQ